MNKGSALMAVYLYMGPGENTQTKNEFLRRISRSSKISVTVLEDVEFVLKTGVSLD